VAENADPARLLTAIAAGDRALARTLLDAVPSLVTAGLARREEFFIERCHAQVYGADPDAAAMGGVTPLHRAVRNRCSAAVEALLAAGADPRLTNDHGSTAADLAHWTTGRGGTGSPAAKAEQRIIIDLLTRAIT
jgi:ankyrin repeat protein